MAVFCHRYFSYIVLDYTLMKVSTEQGTDLFSAAYRTLTRRLLRRCVTHCFDYVYAKVNRLTANDSDGVAHRHEITVNKHQEQQNAILNKYWSSHRDDMLDQYNKISFLK